MLRGEVTDLSSNVKLQKNISRSALDDINAENRMMKEKINAILRRIKSIESSIAEEHNDVQDTIKYNSETVSKHLRADISDEVLRLEQLISDLRSDVKDVVAEQHNLYMDKLKNYTEIVSRTVAEAIAESEFDD